MKAVFLGTPDAAVPILDALVDVVDVSLVVTRADKPRGRSKRLFPPPIKDRAFALALPVAQPTTAGALFDAIESVAPEVAVVAAYGRLLRQEVLDLASHGFVNVHYSLLPRWRGASPVHRAILAGDDVTGATLMLMDAGLDTGPVIVRSEPVPITADATTGSLTGELAAVGADLVRTHLPNYLSGAIAVTPQDDAMATAAGKVSQQEAHLDAERHSAVAIDRAVRAFDPAPGAWATVESERLKVWLVGPAEGSVEPGLAVLDHGRVLLGTREGTLELIEVQPAGRPRMRAVDWMNGRRGEPARLS